MLRPAASRPCPRRRRRLVELTVVVLIAHKITAAAAGAVP